MNAAEDSKKSQKGNVFGASLFHEEEVRKYFHNKSFGVSHLSWDKMLHPLLE